MRAYWRDSQEEISSNQELKRVLSIVKALAEPTMLFLEDENGQTLVLGLGHTESVLTFAEADGVTSFHSIGDRTRTGHIRFWCRDQLDEFMSEMAVPQDVAEAAAFEFFATARRPSVVNWEADW